MSWSLVSGALVRAWPAKTIRPTRSPWRRAMNSRSTSLATWSRLRGWKSSAAMLPEMSSTSWMSMPSVQALLVGEAELRTGGGEDQEAERQQAAVEGEVQPPRRPVPAPAAAAEARVGEGAVGLAAGGAGRRAAAAAAGSRAPTGSWRWGTPFTCGLPVRGSGTAAAPPARSAGPARGAAARRPGGRGGGPARAAARWWRCRTSSRANLTRSHSRRSATTSWPRPTGSRLRKSRWISVVVLSSALTPSIRPRKRRRANDRAVIGPFALARVDRLQPAQELFVRRQARRRASRGARGFAAARCGRPCRPAGRRAGPAPRARPPVVSRKRSRGRGVSSRPAGPFSASSAPSALFSPGKHRADQEARRRLGHRLDAAAAERHHHLGRRQLEGAGAEAR